MAQWQHDHGIVLAADCNLIYTRRRTNSSLRQPGEPNYLKAIQPLKSTVVSVDRSLENDPSAPENNGAMWLFISSVLRFPNRLAMSGDVFFQDFSRLEISQKRKSRSFENLFPPPKKATLGRYVNPKNEG